MDIELWTNKDPYTFDDRLHTNRPDLALEIDVCE